jgi:two-component system, OmpR family, sensor kinase
MRSLFSRIFLSVWLVLAVIMASCIGVTTLVAWHRITTLGKINSRELTKEAAAALGQGGERSLTDWLQQVRNSYSGVDIYVITPAGRDLLQREIPSRLRQWLSLVERGQRVVVSSQGPISPEFQFAASHLLDNADLYGPNGQHYVLAVAWFGSSPIDVLGSYDVTLLLLFLALAISAGVSWSLGRYVSNPIRKLQHSARVLALGDLDTQVDGRVSIRRDEIGVLARDFNHMAAQLKAHISAKEVLLRDVSHELRSPLARIQIALGLAELEKSDVHAQLGRIERDVERMDTLIGEILQLTRLTNEAPAFAFKPVSLSELLGEITQDAALEARSCGKTIQCLGDCSYWIAGNRELLRRAIENVLRNAIRFTVEGSEVTISTAHRGVDLTITVRDRGPGIPEAERQRIFEPFYRVSSSRDRDTGGSGLGLAITARVMTLHGGQARGFNAEGGGLSVELQLPILNGRIENASNARATIAQPAIVMEAIPGDVRAVPNGTA